MTCESCHHRPGILWRPVRSPEGWTVTRVLCPECAGLRPAPRSRLARKALNEAGWALFIVLAAFPAAVVALFVWGAVR